MTHNEPQLDEPPVKDGFIEASFRLFQQAVFPNIEPKTMLDLRCAYFVASKTIFEKLIEIFEREGDVTEADAIDINGIIGELNDFSKDLTTQPAEKGVVL